MQHHYLMLSCETFYAENGIVTFALGVLLFMPHQHSYDLPVEAS